MSENIFDIKEKVFGERLEGITYTDRIGVYGIIFDTKGRVATIKTSTGYFLPGGGVEGEENHEECIKRECIEELGYKVSIEEFIGKASLYHITKTGQYRYGIGYFYTVNVKCKTSIIPEDNNELVWLEPTECVKKLFLEYQAWAVLESLKYIV
jgi:8-oxo-dGTP diphosphatase